MLQQPEVRPANVAMNLWYHKIGRDQEEGHKTLACNICQRSARYGGDMERSRESPVITRDGGISLPDVLRRMGGPVFK